MQPQSSQLRTYVTLLLAAGGLLLGGLLGAGCSSSKEAVESSPTTDTTSTSTPTPTTEANDPVPEGEVEPKKVLRVPKVRARIEEVADEWMGVPYEWGGESKQGVDCSALVQILFQEAFRWRLPRVTELQVQAGSTVTRAELRPGDLVFFQPENQYNHVGLYVGDWTFVHASSSEGVTTTSLADDYWSDYYWTSRRVLGPSKVPDTLAPDLVAYRSPDTTSQRPLAEESTDRPDASSDTEIGTPRDTMAIASCADPDVECDPEGAFAQDTTFVPADTSDDRPGW